jgi:hypothetical protein
VIAPVPEIIGHLIDGIDHASRVNNRSAGADDVLTGMPGTPKTPQ